MTRNAPNPLSSWLKQRRKELDLTQEELAIQVGCARSTIRKLEAGTRRPSKALAQRLVEALQIPPEQRAHFFQQARITHGELSLSSTTLSPPQTPIYYVPAPLSSLIGREADVATVQERLLQPGVRLLTIMGPPGIGKTRLSLGAAEMMSDAFPHGVVFVSLASVNDGALLLPAVARVLGIDESGNEPVLERLHQFLHPRQMLLILDNFEQLVETAPLLSELLAAASGLKLLVTSRVSLRLYAEHRFAVPSLPVPDLQMLPSVEHLIHVPSVALFLQRAQAVMPDFILTNQNAPIVAEICVRLDGLPLAIELAAARMELYSVSALRDELVGPTDRLPLHLLEREALDVSLRQQTMSNAIAWSYQLLLEDNRQLFRQLTVFVGGFTLAAAEAVCSGDDVSEGLVSLLDKSLLQTVPRANRPLSLQDDEPRFTMLRVIREFAWQQLAASGEVEAMCRRRLDYCLELANTAYPNLEGAQTGLWLDRLEEERDNFRAALSWALSENALESGGQLLNLLWWFWHVRGHYSEGRRWLAQALEPERAGALPPILEADLRNAAAVLAWNQSDYGQAQVLLEHSLALHRAAGNQRGIAAVLGNLGIVVRRRGDYAYAQKCQEECLALCRQEARPWYTAVALNNLGELARDRGDVRQARVYWEACLALRRELEDLRGIASVLLNLGDAAFDAGRYRRARDLWQQAQAYLEDLGDRSSLGQAVRGLGDVARMEGDFPQARAFYRQSLAMYKEVGDREGLVAGLEAWAGLAAEQRDLERAALLLGAAEAWREAMRSQHAPADRVHYERIVAIVRAGLTPNTLATIWQRGRALQMEEALQLAATQEIVPARLVVPSVETVATLTAREREVLQLVAAGLNNGEIAVQLVISPTTVSAHLRSIYDKLGIHSRSAATRFALEHGLT